MRRSRTTTPQGADVVPVSARPPCCGGTDPVPDGIVVGRVANHPTPHRPRCELRRRHARTPRTPGSSPRTSAVQQRAVSGRPSCRAARSRLTAQFPLPPARGSRPARWPAQRPNLNFELPRSVRWRGRASSPTGVGVHQLPCVLLGGRSRRRPRQKVIISPLPVSHPPSFRWMGTPLTLSHWSTALVIITSLRPRFCTYPTIVDAKSVSVSVPLLFRYTWDVGL